MQENAKVNFSSCPICMCKIQNKKLKKQKKYKRYFFFIFDLQIQNSNFKMQNARKCKCYLWFIFILQVQNAKYKMQRMQLLTFLHVPLASAKYKIWNANVNFSLCPICMCKIQNTKLRKEKKYKRSFFFIFNSFFL